MRRPLVIAHRGDSSAALENSIEAFRLALSVPVDMIECDVRMSRDGVLYVMHDKQSGRTADRNIDIELAGSDRIAEVRLRNGEPIPTLDDVLALAGGSVGINIEIKSDGAARLLFDRLRSSASAAPMMISSFKESEISVVKRLMPAVPVALIYDTFSIRHIGDYRSKGFSRISLRKNTVTEQLVKASQAQGINVYVWTVDEQDEMKRCIDWGVDGIYTNKPRVLREMISAK